MWYFISSTMSVSFLTSIRHFHSNLIGAFAPHFCWSTYQFQWLFTKDVSLCTYVAVVLLSLISFQHYLTQSKNLKKQNFKPVVLSFSRRTNNYNECEVYEVLTERKIKNRTWVAKIFGHIGIKIVNLGRDSTC